jgi:bacteriorhodopsin
MTASNYHPIRQKMLWVLIVQAIATALVLAGVSAEVVTGWAQWFVGVLNILVLAGVLYKGTTEAERYTTPLDAKGRTLNLEYAYLEHDPED